MGEDTALAHQRMAEIDYLLGDFDSAAAEFVVATTRWRALRWNNDLAVAQSQLGQGGALLRSGRHDEAVALLRPLVLTGAQGYGYQDAQGSGDAEPFAKISYYAATQLADHELATGQDQAAGDDLATALTWADTLDGVVHVDAARNSAAVAALGTGDLTRALVMSTAAVQGDPRSPVYLLTAAEVSQRRGDTTRAIAQYRSALESDPSVYPAANNLAVLLARRGDAEEASRVLRAAVAAGPGYALGWHNLGVVEGRRGPLHVPASQGALARAIDLDPSYADRALELGLDDATYRTSLDVSKPLPQGWSFAGSQRTAPTVTAGLLAAALAGVGLVSLRDTSPSPAAREWLEGVAGRLRAGRRSRRLRRPWWALGATVVAFVLAFREQAVWPWTGLAYIVGIAALVGAAMLVRTAVARRSGRGVVHGTWAPGAVVGLVSGAFGAPFAPLPVVRAPSANLRVALAAPLTLALLSLVLLAQAALLRTPLATSFCVATFIMAGSLLLPVPPLDGSRAGRAGVVGVIGLLGAVLLLGLGLV
ncbi:tetratricopeptide repeat protein [Oryzobacter sp. R7]|uniref:tetratricopeptide repeat protein n=1 Tax=Oryzobacter faecalis TaxID=3388656 RepID=UPI00398C9312